MRGMETEPPGAEGAPGGYEVESGPPRRVGRDGRSCQGSQVTSRPLLKLKPLPQGLPTGSRYHHW